MESPWWYRKRALVIGAIYLAGFWLGAFYDAMIKRPYDSFAQDLHCGIAVVAIMAVCWLVRVWGSSYLRSFTVWSANSRTDALVTDGPFAYTRNPLYLGNVLMAFGLGMLAPPPGWVFINIANMAFTVMLIRWEERGMKERYGGRFAAYCARVPQLFPRFTAAAGEPAAASPAEGLLAEIFTAAILAGSIAVVASPVYGWTIFFILYLLGITAQMLLARRAAAA